MSYARYKDRGKKGTNHNPQSLRYMATQHGKMLAKSAYYYDKILRKILQRGTIEVMMADGTVRFEPIPPKLLMVIDRRLSAAGFTGVSTYKVLKGGKVLKNFQAPEVLEDKPQAAPADPLLAAAAKFRPKPEPVTNGTH